MKKKKKEIVYWDEMIKQENEYFFGKYLIVILVISFAAIFLWQIVTHYYYLPEEFERRNITSVRWETKCDEKFTSETFYEFTCNSNFLSGDAWSGGLIGIGTYNQTQALEFLDENIDKCDEWESSTTKRTLPSEKICYQVLVREVDKN